VRGGIARDRRSVLFGGARRRRRRVAAGLLALAVVGAVTGALIVVVPVGARPAPPPTAQIAPSAPAPPTDDGRGTMDVVYPAIRWRISRPLGAVNAGELADGVRLPASGPDWFTWDPVRDVVPNRPWRRWGTDALLRTTLAVLREYRAADPRAPRVGIMDLSRHRGGFFGARYGGLGHASHQNGLDVDIMWPRRDGRERRPFTPGQVDRKRAQDLVNRFRAAGAEKLFVGPSLGLRGPKGVVIPLDHHDDHLHLRIPPPPS